MNEAPCQCDQDSRDHDMWCCPGTATILVRRGAVRLFVCEDCVLSSDTRVRCWFHGTTCEGTVEYRPHGQSRELTPLCEVHA